MLTASGSGAGAMLVEVSPLVALPQLGRMVSFRIGGEENRLIMRSRRWMMRSQSRYASGKQPRRVACAIGGTVGETFACSGVTDQEIRYNNAFTIEDGSLLIARLENVSDLWRITNERR